MGALDSLWPFHRGHSKRSSHTSKKRHSSSTKRSERFDTAEDGEPRPDIDELRSRRTDYYNASPDQRRRATRVERTAQRVRDRTSLSSHNLSGRKAAVKSSIRRHRTGASRAKKGTSNSRDRVYEEDVYNKSLPDIPHEANNDDDNITREETDHVSAFPFRRTTTVAPESEVYPDDSISQVEGRSAGREQDRAARPSLKRSKTTSTKKTPPRRPQANAFGAYVSPTSTKTHSSSRASNLSRRHSTTSVPAPPRLVECLTCGSDDIPEAKSAKLECGHIMCQDCLRRIFELSVKDPAHMPPKCCTAKHIPLKHVDKLFDTKFKNTWNRKYEEYHTKNRIYCPTRKCGEWIKPSHVHKDNQGRKYAQCPRCNTKVCTHCNNKMHKSRDCPKDPEIEQLISTAKEKGWQRCHECHALVEKKEGCNHMTCRCKAEFCMICGAKWKSCDCPWFDQAAVDQQRHRAHGARNHHHPADQLRGMRVALEEWERLGDALFQLGLPVNAPAARAERDRIERLRQWMEIPNEAQEAGNAGLPGGPRGFRQERDARNAQEIDDEAFARRLQALYVADLDQERNGHMDRMGRDPARRRTEVQNFNFGNAAEHFLNADFVFNAANVVMDAFANAHLGDRGEARPAAPRRRRARRSGQLDRAGEQDGELVVLPPDFPVDDAVPGAAPAGARDS